MGPLRRKRQGLVFILSGPSGAGKTTLLRRLVKAPALKNRLVRSISLTTRPRRSREKEGVDYFFITPRQFQQRRRAKKILEWTKYIGYYYATPKEALSQYSARGKHIILCLDVKGALGLKRLYPQEAKLIFIIPPVLEVLKERIEKRCQRTNAKEIKERLKLAEEEMEACRRYDYSLVNKNLEETTKELERIILKEIRKREEAKEK